nr:hypothetical protein [Tanacetum cinerariifolium]
GNPQFELQEKGVIDSGFSRHMTENMSYLSEYEEIDGGYVAFGGDPKGGKITGKGKISTDTECVVLSFNFKLLDESQVLLRVPRKNNMYSVDLKIIALLGGLTCIENLKDLRVKVIRCDNGTKFKNKVMNQLCEMKGKARVETILDKDYIVLPLWTLDPLFSSSSKDSHGDGFKPSGEEEKNDTEDLGNKESEALITEEPRVNQEKDSVNNTNRVNVVSSTVNAASNEVNDVGIKSSIELPNDPNMPNLKDISIFEYSDEVFGADADLNNMKTTNQVSPIPITRIQKDHPLEQSLEIYIQHLKPEG